jgi:hypothetical protein
MNKIFRSVLVGAMLAGLMVAPLGGAQADDVIDGWITVPVPKTASFATFSQTVMGKTINNATVDNSLGGSLTVFYDAQAWVPSHSSDCPAGYVGQNLQLTARRPGGTFGAIFTPAGGGTATTLGPTDVAPKDTQAGANVCLEP